nr:14811_t:CDS:2 [Entrophospora candida]
MSVFSTSNKEFNDLHLRSLLASAKTPQELQPAKTPFFALEFNTSHPRVYQAPDGGYYINQFLHPNPPPFYQFSKETQDQKWFLPKITHKIANERIITRQFNKELEGEVLLVLEEMSNSKSGDWIAFANRFKDFIDSDTLMIEI